MVKDKFGTPINVGDTVVAAVRWGSGAALRKGEVKGFTKTGGVRVCGKSYSWQTDVTTVTIWPAEMMVVPPTIPGLS